MWRPPPLSRDFAAPAMIGRRRARRSARFLTSGPARLISAPPIDWAPVAELADAHGSGPCSERSGGSTPLGRTIRIPPALPIPLGWFYAGLCTLRYGDGVEPSAAGL